MTKYFIAWNADKSEGFITDSEADANSAISGFPNCKLGYLSQSVLGDNFFETYGEEGDCPAIEEIELPSERAK